MVRKQQTALAVHPIMKRGMPALVMKRATRELAIAHSFASASPGIWST
jgi:hypothetical protein